MSLPGNYANVQSYFEDAVAFLETYQWIYNHPNTHILVNKVLDDIPVEWKIHLRSLGSNFSLAKTTQDAPPSLQSFFNDVLRLKPQFDEYTHECDHTFPKNSRLSRKKAHEIRSFAPFVHKICQDSGARCIIDVGTGLGYLPRLLYEKYSYPILAIEGDRVKINLARSFPSTNAIPENQIHYVEHFITENSAETLELLAAENQIESACITGLHACADLSVTMLKLFAQLSFARALVIMPCCYHRLQMTNKEEYRENFRNFPASDGLKTVFVATKADRFLRTYFLRVACQNAESICADMTGAQQERHARNWLCRAILQEVANEVNCEVTRLKRKSGRGVPRPGTGGVADADDFEAYLASLTNTHALAGGVDINDSKFLNRMREKWTEHKENCYLIEALARFQSLIQSICENLVLLDRVQFLTEKGAKCWVEKTADERLSPRCYALVATKSQTTLQQADKM